MPLHGGAGPPSNTWFFEPTRVHIANGVWLVHPFLHGSGLRHTDRRTDHDWFIDWVEVFVSRSTQVILEMLFLSSLLTRTETDHATPSATIGRIYVVVQCGLIQIKTQIFELLVMRRVPACVPGITGVSSWNGPGTHLANWSSVSGYCGEMQKTTTRGSTGVLV